jgi:TRAP-type C4-dicarboxylate transport system permease large subunit
MNWYHYVACFFAGMFLANAVPHFVKGVSGDRFPSPFSRPAGKALSSPLVNALWGLLNFVIGYILFRAGRVSSQSVAVLAVFLAGVTIMSVMLSVNFAKKDKE